MKNQNSDRNSKQINMCVRGHEVTLWFADEYNPNLAQLVRNTLLDSYIRQNGLYDESKSA